MLTHLLLVLTTLPAATPADNPCLAVIVNAENPTTVIEAKTLERMFFKKHKGWDHSVPVQPIDQDPGLPIRQAFSHAVHGKEVSAILKYWQRMIFSGRDVPPPTARDDDEVIEYVSEHPGGVGYVYCSSVAPWLGAPPAPWIRIVEVRGLRQVSTLSVKHEVLDIRYPRSDGLLAPLLNTALVVTPTVVLGQDEDMRLYLAGFCGGVGGRGEGAGRWIALENLDAESPRSVAVEHRILAQGRLRHQTVETYDLPPGHVQHLACSKRGDVEHRFTLVGGS